MQVSLTADQEAWLLDRVAKGEFASIEDTVRRLVDQGFSALRDGDRADIPWAVPMVEAGQAAFERGDVMPLEEHKTRNAMRRATRLGQIG